MPSDDAASGDHTRSSPAESSARTSETNFNGLAKVDWNGLKSLAGVDVSGLAVVSDRIFTAEAFSVDDFRCNGRTITMKTGLHSFRWFAVWAELVFAFKLGWMFEIKTHQECAWEFNFHQCFMLLY